jgi:phosphate starvation-inducible protein PhoH and related proteins
MARRKPNKKSPLVENHLVLAEISPMTKNQSLFFDNYDTDKSQVLIGYPGTGKTFMALYRAFQEINNPETDYQRIVIVRSAVPTRDVGFLPGTLAEKGEVYELPYKSICTELFGRADAYEVLKKHRTVEFITTSFIRGLTLDKAIIIVVEFQNMTAHEADSVITRVGSFSKILLCGDILQRDLNKNCEKNIEILLKVLDQMPDDFDFTYFDENDIVRSGLVGNYIRTKHKIFPDGY